MIANSQVFGTNLLICPKCGTTYMHIQKVGERQSIASLPDNLGELRKFLGYGNEDLVAIRLWCENGDHKTIMVLNDHKGNVYVNYFYKTKRGWKEIQPAAISE